MMSTAVKAGALQPLYRDLLLGVCLVVALVAISRLPTSNRLLTPSLGAELHATGGEPLVLDAPVVRGSGQ